MRKRLPLVDILRPFGFALIMTTVLIVLLGFRLNTLMPGYSQAEIDTLQSAQPGVLTIRSMLDNSLYLPYKIALYALRQADLLTMTSLRGLSAVFGLTGIMAFHFILRKWHTRRMALIGTVLLATSSVYLQASRVAGPEAMYLLLPLLLALGIKIEEGTRRLSVAVLSVMVVAGLLYLPGMVWLLGGGLLWQRHRIMDRIREIPSAAVVLLSGLAIFLLIPLGTSLATNGSFWLDWLGYPLQDQSVAGFVRNIVVTPWHVFFRHVASPEFHVGRLPILDVAATAFVILGLYWYFYQRKLDRTKLIAAGLILGGLLTAALGLRLQVVMLPFLYLLATGGATLMLQQWFTVFPRNPLARGVGLGIVIGMVGLMSFYHLSRYFVAWPNTPSTKQVYSLPSVTINE